jgi:hypothetical protein
VPKTPKSGAGLERNHLPLSAEITCRFRPKSGAGLLRFLHSRALEILGALVERRGNIVSKEEIMGTGWPRTVVAEGNLFVQTAALRQILGAAQPFAIVRRIIETLKPAFPGCYVILNALAEILL